MLFIMCGNIVYIYLIFFCFEIEMYYKMYNIYFIIYNIIELIWV